jgi:hypothetical protein
LITDYHWNNGMGAKGGTIGLEDSDGNEIGTWPVTVRNGVYWDVHPNTVIDPGEYKVVDSDPSTWAQNLESDNSGITDVKGYAITYQVLKNTTNPTTGIGTTSASTTGHTTPSVQMVLTPLTSKTLQPSTTNQQVSWNNTVTVTVPGGVLTSSQPLTISSADKLPADTFSGSTPLATYDISLGNMHEFNQYLTIELAYDSAKLQSDLPADQSIYAEWWDSTQNMWWRTESQMDTQRNVVDIKTDHLTPWRIVMVARGDRELRTDHFIVVFNDTEVPKIGSVAQNPLTFAQKVGNYLEAAYQVYLAAGYEVTPPASEERTWVVINQSASESETGTLSGDITLKSQFRDENEVKQDTAHELFHTTHLRKAGLTTYLQSHWWADACADYAATRIAWPNLPGMAMLSGDYMRSPLVAIDSIHEYETAEFVDYLVSHGINFSQVFNEMCKGVPTPENLDAYVQEITGQNLLTQYRSFLEYAFFDSHGPVQDVYLRPTLLRGSGSSAGSPNSMSATTKDISYQMLMNGGYGGWLWGFSVDIASPATSRTLTISLSPLTSDSLPAGEESFSIYLLHNDQRVTGGTKAVTILSSAKRSANITVSQGDVVYILGIDAATPGIANEVDIKDADASGQKWVQTGVTQTLDPATATPGKSVTVSGSKATFAVDSQAGVYKANWSCSWKGTPPNTPPLNWSGTATGTPGPGNTLNLTVSGTSNGVTYQGQWLAYYPASSAASYFTSDWSGKVTVVSTENGASQNVIAESGGSGDKSDWVFVWPDLPTTLTPGQTFTGTLTANDGGSAIATQDSVSGLLEFVLNPPWSGMTPGMGLESPSVSVKVPGKPTVSRNFTWEIPGPTNKQMTITVSCSAVNGGSVAQAKIVYTYELR